MPYPEHFSCFILASRPKNEITPETFRLETVPFNPNPGRGEVLVQIQYLSIDPALRLLLNVEGAYREPVEIGGVMTGIGLGVVLQAGAGASLVPGDMVSGSLGWTEYAILAEHSLTKIDIPRGGQVLDFLGPLGHIGLTAVVGLLDYGQLRSGETLLVSGAAGAVGAIVCQLAKARGAKVYAIAGSAEKCAYLENEVGVHKALNYKTPNFKEEFAAIDPFDVFFDNVGGEILNLALTKLNVHARVVICGRIAGYNNSEPTPLTTYGNLLPKRAKILAFSLVDEAARFVKAKEILLNGIQDGTLHQKYHILQGLSTAPKALNMLFSGENNGKLVVKL
ncbi:uncharacterized protein FIBRA_03608 [Fibroporia radiculosa]|uniref:Enoyl reductase (ER) domain-containing protein n=1 Tax=Fibroporia radiculosa TaxID=599839 RepID=J4GNK5_9APHY|nr:uncharacterized protein FIBRA_03608 [Fibroporia radiculosa]CCM01550.1 predicted protein [Fibroporia radiculosa]